MAKAKIKALPKRRRATKAKKSGRKKSISLTQLAIKQIELMLIAEYQCQGKVLPEPARLRRLAERFHRKHFDN